jgi:hypothetical protein
LLLENEKGGEVFPLPLEGQKYSLNSNRAVMVGQVWSADLVEVLMEVYGHLLQGGYSLEEVSRLAQDTSHDGSGD